MNYRGVSDEIFSVVIKQYNTIILAALSLAICDTVLVFLLMSFCSPNRLIYMYTNDYH